MPINGFPGGVISSTAVTPSVNSASGVWTLDEQLQNSANWPVAPALLTNSTRFRRSASAYLSRTPSVTGNRKTWTFSAWIKRGQLGNIVFPIFTAGSQAQIRFEDDNGSVRIYADSGALNITTSQKFRDPSAWYHFVFVLDTTQATDTNRFKIYVNGSQLTNSGTYPAQNTEFNWNTTSNVHNIGALTSESTYFDGYMADVNFIDGQALTPNYFGATDGATGVWEPANYKGTYGTNGFYLPMNIEVLQKSFTKSLRFRASNNAYLSRTPAVSGNQNKWTWSAWIKRGTITGEQVLLAGGTTNNDYSMCLRFSTDGNIVFQPYTSSNASPGVYRDPASWYHIVFTIDLTNSTTTDRVRIWVNNQLVVSTTYDPSWNFYFNGAGTQMAIGRPTMSWGYVGFDGYMAEINFIDGLALTPGYFGQTDSTSGAWQPIAYTGQYGTNGYYLPFTNTASTTTLGYDASGRNNNWTTNNISLTAGATYDSMTDVPTLTSATEANFAVINPLAGSTIGTFDYANLRFYQNTSTWARESTTIGFTTGKFYAEFAVTQVGDNSWQAGVTSSPPTRTSGNQNGEIDGSSFFNANQIGGRAGCIWNNSSYPTTGLSASVNGDVIGVAFDADTATVKYYRNGSQIGNTGGYVINNISGVWYFQVFSKSTDSTGSYGIVDANFGQRPFAYTPPTGFVALNAYNM